MALTERQQQIDKLLKDGRTPKQIGEQLGISENAVYQQRRRIKAAASSKRSSKPAASKTTQAKRPTQKPRPAASPAAGNGHERSADPLAEVRRRKAEIDSLLSGAKATLSEAAKAHESAQKAYDDAEGKVKVELERLGAVEALLTGKLKPPKPGRKAKAEEPKAEEPKAEAEAQPEPKAEAQPEPEPEAEPEPAVAAPEASAQDEAAEAPDEPTEVPSASNGSGEEERPGVPSVPEFTQEEDAFAS